MSDTSKDFDDPKRIAINRVYTKKGDKGLTSLVGGQKVAKSSKRISTYGELDELNSFVGAARHEALAAGDESLAELANDLRIVQHHIFNLGSLLATLPEDVHPRQPQVRDIDIEWLERRIDTYNHGLPTLRSFILPGGSRLNIELHICRTICRRVEREVAALMEVEQVDAVALRWLNRLSDAFFVWSRWVIHAIDGAEELWDPNAVAETEPIGE